MATTPTAKRGRPVGYRKDVTRPHLISVRLSEDERGWLLSRVVPGEREADVIRGLIETARRIEMDQETQECAYCSRDVAQVEPVPTVSDDKGWERAARGHAKDCEWVRTRAHQRDGGE